MMSEELKTACKGKSVEEIKAGIDACVHPVANPQQLAEFLKANAG